MRGVFKRKGCISTPYEITKTINGKQVKTYFATEEEAVKALCAYKESKIQLRYEAKKALASKRASDLAKSGDSSSLERRIAVQIVEAWQTMTGRKALVLNDGTRGDLLLEREDGNFLVVQLKTTHDTKKGSNGYHFINVKKKVDYDDMPVVCWCETKEFGWVADGAILNERNKNDLKITPGERIEREYTLTKQAVNMQQLVTFLTDHIDDWPSSSEEAARHDLPSATNQKEMRGIDAYKQRFPDSIYEWPTEQNGHVDITENDKRLQIKTAYTMKSRAGLLVNLHTSAGKDTNGKRLFTPYPHDAFDILVVVWEDEDGTYHFWRIPSTELTARGYLSTTQQPGKTCLWVYGPVGPQPKESARKKADMWTQTFYQSLAINNDV